MKLIFISDTHGKHEQLSLPPGDVLIHTGDVSGRGTVREIQSFLDWFSEQDYKYKVFIAGNHDFLAERAPSIFRSLLSDQYIYLENETVTIEGIKIWGSPATPWFHNWAFNYARGAEIKAIWDTIPMDTDIILTHGPPKGIGDFTITQVNAGCEELLKRVRLIQPRYHVFGHIHEAAGIYEQEPTTFINASVLNIQYQLVNDPVVIDFEVV